MSIVTKRYYPIAGNLPAEGQELTVEQSYDFPLEYGIFYVEIDKTKITNLGLGISAIGDERNSSIDVTKRFSVWLVNSTLTSYLELLDDLISVPVDPNEYNDVFSNANLEPQIDSSYQDFYFGALYTGGKNLDGYAVDGYNITYKDVYLDVTYESDEEQEETVDPTEIIINSVSISSNNINTGESVILSAAVTNN